MREIIEDCRSILGQPPRKFTIFDWANWQIFSADWMSQPSQSAYGQIYSDQKLLRTEGRVVWASLVQANRALFEPGIDNLPAVCIWSPDPWFDDNVAALRATARGLFAVKGKRSSDPAVQQFADNLADEQTPWLKLPLPRSITDGREVYYSVFMVHRKHLPTGFLSQGFFPMLVLPERSRACMILPDPFWPDDLKRAWAAGSLAVLRPSARARTAGVQE